MSHIVIENHGAVRVIRIARPEKKNALTVAMYTAMVEALDGAKDDATVKTVAILGAPGVFTAGNDLKDFMSAPPTGNDSAVFKFLIGLVDFPKPIIAGVDGPAVGIGTTMLFHCDYIVATPTARMHMPFLNLGLVPEGGSSVLLPALIGMARASELLLLGEPFTGERAAQLGIVNQLANAAELESTVLAVAAKFASKPAEAMRISKDLIRGPQREALRATIAREGKLFIERLASTEAQEAFFAFMAKKG
jgi:enoyl-CoA hydratase/carnithine racemase